MVWRAVKRPLSRCPGKARKGSGPGERRAGFSKSSSRSSSRKEARFGSMPGMLYERMFAYNRSMQLWILRPRFDVLEREAHPWTPPWDKTMGVLVRAETEEDARQLAQTKAGFEGEGIYARLGLTEDEVAEKVWLAEKWTACEELTPDGEAGVILVVRHGA